MSKDNRRAALRDALKLELLDWQGDRYRGDEDMPFEEITRLNDIGLNVTLDNLEKIVATERREAAETELMTLLSINKSEVTAEEIMERLAELRAEK